VKLKLDESILVSLKAELVAIGPLLIRLALIPVSHAGAFQVEPELKKNWPKI
jgi:hypothetical protein